MIDNKIKFSEEEKLLYKPTSLTLTLYDTINCVYGFTYNTKRKPLFPVLQINKGTSLTKAYEEYPANATEAFSYNRNDEILTYYIVKSTAHLAPSSTYTYRVYDKGADIGTEPVTIHTKDASAPSFSFAHISDSQSYGRGNQGEDTDVYFAKTLSQIVEKNDFALHTGDIVEWGKYESYWENMLHKNFRYLSLFPIMPISGNHETTYQCGSNETFKHFNNNIPSQESTKLGYYYSFEYGNVKFIMVNTNDLIEGKIKDEQYDWLVRELESNTCDWTVVSIHNPMYSVGKYGSDPTRNRNCLALRSQLGALFAKHGVDIVLQGHDHNVSRTYPINERGEPTEEKWKNENDTDYSVDPCGVIYLMNGPAGDQVRDPYAIEEGIYKYAHSSKMCSWAEFNVSGNKMEIAIKHYDGKTIDTYHAWGIKKTSTKFNEKIRK